MSQLLESVACFLRCIDMYGGLICVGGKNMGGGNSGHGGGHIRSNGR